MPPNTTVNLADTFVFNPGRVRGDIFLCGPDEGTNANSCLRRIYLPFDDANHDGIPDSFNLSGIPRVIAYGRHELGAGATKTAGSGVGNTLYAGSFFASGPNKNKFVGDYRLTLGGLLGEITHWDQQWISLQFYDVATPAVRDNYINCTLGINNRNYQDVEIVPTKTVTNDHRYGFSQVKVTFRATSGTLFRPFISGHASFNGLNFEGRPAQYSVELVSGEGTPIDLASATADGQVVLCIPEGDYTFNPTIESVNPGGGSSHNTLLPITYSVQPCRNIVFCPELQMTLTSLPMCATNRLLHVSGSTVSQTNVARIYYELNGAAPVNVCNNCDPNLPFGFDIVLADCVNTLKVTATNAGGCVASVESTIQYDLTPPDLAGCTNILASADAGTNGTVVNYAVTATDNCDSTVPVTCTPPPGFFPAGQTLVTCRAVDSCKNTNTCSFTVTVGAPCLRIANDTVTCAGTNGAYTYTFSLTNLFSGPIHWLAFNDPPPGVGVEPSLLLLDPPLASGQGTNLSVTLYLTNAAMGRACFLLSVHDFTFMECCSTEHCIDLPKCCARITGENLLCATNGLNDRIYSFTLQNLTEFAVEYVTLIPLNDCFNFDPDVLHLPAVLGSGQSVTVSVGLQTSVNCPSNLCFLLGLHTSDLFECCSLKRCLPLDTRPPVILCPSNMMVEAQGPSGTTVAFTVTATNSAGSNLTVNCTPPSQSLFPPGSTLVRCTTRDSHCDEVSCSFTITVGTYDLWVEDTPQDYDGPPDLGREPDPNMDGLFVWSSRSMWVHNDCSRGSRHLSLSSRPEVRSEQLRLCPSHEPRQPAGDQCRPGNLLCGRRGGCGLADPLASGGHQQFARHQCRRQSPRSIQLVAT